MAAFADFCISQTGGTHLNELQLPGRQKRRRG